MTTKTTFLRIDGIVCFACAGIIEDAARSVSGVTCASVNYVGESLRVETAQGTDVQTVIAAIQKRGYGAHVIAERDAVRSGYGDMRGMRLRIIITFLLSLPLVRNPFFAVNPWICLIAATAVQFIAGRHFYREAVSAAMSRTVNMSALVSLGTFAAYALSAVNVLRGAGELFFESTGTVLVLVMIGKYLERGARLSSSESVKRLFDLPPVNATILINETETTVASAEIKTGDRMVIKRGEIFPADGIVASGKSAADESGLTGESRHVPKNIGDTVYGTTINVAGKLEITADRDYAENVYVKMLRALTSGMDGEKPRVQRLADRVGARFLPAAIAVSIVTLFVWYGYVAPGDLARAVTNAVAVLIVACPCAMGIATPLAVTMSVGALGKSGVFVKNPAALETLAQTDAVVFDKTGTLTTGDDDRLRSGAPKTAATLSKMNVAVYMLTGDTHERAETAAAAAKIANFRAGLLPEDKAAFIADLRKSHTVAMVGDGVNDALSLKSADVGIAIGRAAEVSLECADVVITRNRITHVLKALYAGRVMMKNVRRSLFWALIYNVAGLLLAACGIISPVIAGAAMSLSSLCVVLNARSLERRFARITFDLVENS